MKLHEPIITFERLEVSEPITLEHPEVSKANADTSAVARANRADQKDVKLREPLLENDSQCSSILDKPKRLCFQTDKVHFSSISEKPKDHFFKMARVSFRVRLERYRATQCRHRSCVWIICV